MDWIEITAIVLGAILVIGMPYFASQWSRAKLVITVIDKALEDDKITPDEIRAIVAALLGK